LLVKIIVIILTLFIYINIYINIYIRIIILEPSIDAKFGNPELNIPGPKRDNKMQAINMIRLELTEYLEKSTEKVNTAFFDDLVRRDDKKVQYMVVIKKL
jgi:hypothetical protein